MGRRIPLVVCVLLGVQPSADAGEKPGAVVDKSLRTYSEKHRVPRDQIRPCGMSLLPGRQAFYHRLPAVPADQPGGPLPERHAVLFVDSVYGVIELKLMPDGNHKHVVRTLLAAMTLTGRKVRSNRDAAEVFTGLFVLDGWLTGRELSEYKPPAADQLGRLVNGPYRRRPGIYGTLGSMRLVGGDDLGMAVDENGYVTDLLSGHIR